MSSRCSMASKRVSEPRRCSWSTRVRPSARPPSGSSLRGVDYQQALDHLDRHVNLEKTGAIAGKVEGLTLEPMQRLMHVLGDPQKNYPIIHITGTNGKGSTARM